MLKRNLFSEIYLDDAATSRYKPPAVERAVLNALRRSANPGRSGHDSALEAAMTVEDCRFAIREYLGDGEVVFTKNCTEALNLALFGSDLRGIVLTTVFEHNSVLRPLHYLKRLGRIQPVYAAPAKGFTLTENDFERALNGRSPAFIVCGGQSNVTGAKQDIVLLKRLKQRYHCPLLIDGAQSLGHTDDNYEGCLVAASGHKGLHGPQGTGFLYLPRDTRLTPLLYGGTGTESANPNQPASFPEGYESGTLNTPGIAGLKEGVVWTAAHHAETAAHLKKLGICLYNGLKEIKGVKLYSPPKSTVISFTIKDGDSAELGNRLNADHHIAVRGGLHCAPKAHEFLGTLSCGTVRASVGVHNTEREIERFLYAIKKIANEF